MHTQRTRHRLHLRDNPGEWATGAAITAYDGTTWADHGETDPEHRDVPYSSHSGPGQVRVEYRDEFAKGSPFLLSLEGPWGVDATATMTVAEADNLRRLLEVLLLDADPMWHLHNARVEDEIEHDGTNGCACWDCKYERMRPKGGQSIDPYDG